MVPDYDILIDDEWLYTKDMDIFSWVICRTPVWIISSIDIQVMRCTPNKPSSPERAAFVASNKKKMNYV